MTVTFIAHSAYLVEWDKFYTLFDYTYEPDYTGELPELNPDKPLLVFASHSHEDHFDAKVFTLLEKYPDTRFFVSRDTRLTERKRQWLNISDEAFARTTVLRPDSILLTDVAGEDLSIRAIKSTDIGNAYLLRAEGKMVYHGGDLNWWNWESEGKAYCNNMTVHYHAAIEKLASAVRNEATDNNIAPEITAAMAPLDPRLGEGSEGLGIEYLLKNVTVQHVFPMHMWKKYEVIDRYIAAHPDEKGIIARITRDGQRFENKKESAFRIAEGAFPFEGDLWRKNTDVFFTGSLP